MILVPNSASELFKTKNFFLVQETAFPQFMFTFVRIFFKFGSAGYSVAIPGIQFFYPAPEANTRI